MFIKEVNDTVMERLRQRWKRAGFNCNRLYLKEKYTLF